MKTVKKFKAGDYVKPKSYPYFTPRKILRITRNTWGKTMYVLSNDKKYFAEDLTL